MKHQFISFQTIVPQTYQLSYQICLPKDYEANASQIWPMILSLHGSAARGTNPDLILKEGLPETIESGVEYPFVVVSPQCPSETWWSDHLPALDILLKEIADRYRVDQERISLTGVSMGAYGVWHLASTYPDRFAALIPISGGAAWFYGFPERVRSLAKVPTWIFHGEADPITPLREAVVLSDELKSVGIQSRLTIIPEGGHDIWRQVYRMPELMNWLLEQRKGN